jgi:hypothetical protein
MSLHSVKAFLAEHAPDIAVLELSSSTATVAPAASPKRCRCASAATWCCS